MNDRERNSIRKIKQETPRCRGNFSGYFVQFESCVLNIVCLSKSFSPQTSLDININRAKVAKDGQGHA